MSEIQEVPTIFQFLKGTIKSSSKNTSTNFKATISIPKRYD